MQPAAKYIQNKSNWSLDEELQLQTCLHDFYY